MKRPLHRLFLNVGLVSLTLLLICCQEKTPALQTGDIVFQDFNFGNSQAIKLISHSKYSHVGMIVLLDGKTYVYEAVQPVQVTPFKDWISRNEKGEYEVKRLKNADALFTPEKMQAFKQEMNKYTGKDYDGRFEWSDKKMYCSEVIWKIYKRVFNLEVGKIQLLDELDLSNPVVVRKLEEIYGGEIPLHEQVISPQAMLESSLLESVQP